MTEFTLPELGENIESGDVVRVLVKTGDALEADQPVLELETDKATIEVPSSVSGVVKEIRVKAGDKVKVGQGILVVDEGAEGKAAPPKEEAASAAPAERDAPKQGPPPTKDAPARTGAAAEGGLAHDVQARRPAGEAAEQGAKEREEGVGEVEEAGKPEGSTPGRGPGRVVDISAGRAPAAPTAPVPAAPSTRRFAPEVGVDVAGVPGWGPGGRISTDDVKAHARKLIAGGGGRAASHGGT